MDGIRQGILDTATDPVLSKQAEDAALSRVLQDPKIASVYGPNVPETLAGDPVKRQLLQEAVYMNAYGQQTKPVVTSDQTREELNKADGAINKAEGDFKANQAQTFGDGRIAYGNAPGSPIYDATGKTVGYIGGDGQPVFNDGTKLNAAGLTDSQQAAFNQQRQLNQDQQNALLGDVNAQIERERIAAVEAHGQQSGMAIRQLARMGALNVTTAGVQYINDLQVRHQRELTSLMDAGMRAIERARNARTEADLKALQMELETVQKNKENIIKEKEAYIENLKGMEELRKLQNDSWGTTLEAYAKAGYTSDTIPDGYLEKLDLQMGMAPGTSGGLLDFANEQVVEGKEIERAEKLYKLLNQVPVGEKVVIDGMTYFGRDSKMVEVDEKGNAYIFTTDSNGKVSKQNLGFVGSPGNLSFHLDGAGYPWAFDSKSGKLAYAGPSTADFSSAIPEGSYGGQCGVFVRNWTGIRVGDTLASKEAIVDKTIGTQDNPVQVGDAVVFSGGASLPGGGTTGHIAIVNSVNVGPDGKNYFRLTESNQKGDEKVTHTRQVAEDDPTLRGFARGELNPKLQVGTDRSWTPVPAKGTTPTSTSTTNYANRQLTFADIDRLKKGGAKLDYTHAGMTVAEAMKAGLLTSEQAKGSLSGVDLTDKLYAVLDKGTFSEFRYNQAISSYNALIEAGDFDGAERKIKGLAYDQLGQQEKKDYLVYENSVPLYEDALANITENWENYNSGKIQIGPWKDLFENNVTWAQIDKDPAYAELKQSIGMAEAQIRRAFFGTAVTKNEQGSSDMFLFSPMDNIETIEEKIRFNMAFAEFTNDKSMSHIMDAEVSDFGEYKKRHGARTPDVVIHTFATGTILDEQQMKWFEENGYAVQQLPDGSIQATKI